jgi:voltage-gated potassium channel Kch
VTLVARTRRHWKDTISKSARYINHHVGVCGRGTPTMLQVAATLGSTIVVLWAAFRYMSAGHPRPRSAAVVVLGDIGRSPRIMYHAQSFALNGFETYVVGYEGKVTKLMPT